MEINMEEKKKLGKIFNLTLEEIERIDDDLDVTKFLITDIDIRDFCAKYKINYQSVYRYLFAITNPNDICARCINSDIANKINRQNISFNKSLFPCTYCTRNPKYKDYFSDGSNN